MYERDNDFCHKLGNSAMVFTGNEFTSEYRCRIASQVTKNLIHTYEYIIFF